MGPFEGLGITRYGYVRPRQGIEILEAAHPLPEEWCLNANPRILELVSGLGKNDHLLVLMSGGASAFLIALAEGVKLAEKQAVNAALLASGAPVDKMNPVRKHLSRV